MSEEQQQQHLEDEDSMVSAILYLFAFLIALVGVLSFISKIFGIKMKLKGANIPTDPMAITAFFVIAGIAGGIGFVLDLRVVRTAFRRNGWLWVVLVVMFAGSCAGTIHGINIWDAGGFKMYAASKGDVAKVRGYLKDKSVTKVEINQMLTKAFNNRHDGLVEVLLKEGKADPNVAARWPKGATLFHRVCAYGRMRAVQAFVANGAKLNAPDAKGHSPLYHALTSPWGPRRDKRREVLRFLIQKGAKMKGPLKPSERSRLRSLLPTLADGALGVTRPKYRKPTRQPGFKEPNGAGKPKGTPPMDDGQGDDPGGPSPFDP